LPVRCHAADGVIVCTYEGAVSADELTSAVVKAVELSRACGAQRFLANVTGLAGGHSPVDLLAVVDLLEKMGLPRTLREAVVVSPATASAMDVQFYEDAARNRGWNVRIFSDEASALAWLRAP
jgi:hypothetical protein